VDYRALNKVIVPQYFPLGSLETVIEMIGEQKAELFSCLDQRSSFFSIKLSEKSKQYTSFSTKSGHWQYTRLAQGLRNSPHAYMQAISDLLRSELATTGMLYIDDLCLFSSSYPVHESLLKTVFDKFRSANLRMNAQKCRFCVEEVTFLGFQLNREGAKIDPSRFEAIRTLPRPTTQKEVKRILGLFNYFRKWLPNCTKIMTPMRELLCKNTPFAWTDRHEEAFEKLKELILANTTLVYPRMDREFIVRTDASSQALGFSLSQLDDFGVEKYISFNGRNLHSWERHASAAMLELYSLMQALITYQHYLSYGKHFTVITDSMSLTFIQNLKHGPSKLIRYSLFLSNYTFSIRHCSGSQNQLCDLLSRRPYPPENEEHLEPLLGLHPHHFLGAIDVEGLQDNPPTQQGTCA
jgi:putative transposase